MRGEKMEYITERTGDAVILKISGRVTIADANELKQIIMREISPACNITVDLADVAECDLTLFQLLCAGHKRSLKTSGSMKLCSYSEEVYETMRSAGILRNTGCIENTNENCLWQQKGIR